MNALRSILFGLFSVTLIAAIASVGYLKSVNADQAALSKIDTPTLVFDHACQLMDSGQGDKAAAAFSAVFEKYNDPRYTERSLRSLASIYTQKGDTGTANNYLSLLVKNCPGIPDAAEIQAKVEDFGVKKFMTQGTTGDTSDYVVQKGDTLYGIAKKTGTTVELIKKMNNLNSDVIHPGDKLKVNVAKFSIIVDKSDNILVLSKNGQPFKTYTVATGKNNSTPVGVFTITDKMVKPNWTKPGEGVISADSEKYELGARWIPISKKGYGIHGTNDETLIGKQSTGGCVRMKNADVIELYDLVTKGTQVEIKD